MFAELLHLFYSSLDNQRYSVDLSSLYVFILFLIFDNPKLKTEGLGVFRELAWIMEVEQNMHELRTCNFKKKGGFKILQ